MSKNPFADPNFGAPSASSATAANPFADPDFGKDAESPGLLRSAGDSAIALGSGITQGVKMLADVAGADNAASRVLGKATDALTDLASPYAKAKKQKRAEKIKAAEDSGSTWEEVKAYAGSFADAPLDTTLNALGTSAAPLVAGALSGGAAVPAIVVRAAQMGLAAAQGVGGIKGQIHESVKQKHLDAGATDAEASKRADEAQAYAGPNAGSIALGGALGALAGGTGAESAVRRAVGQRLASEAVDKAAPGVLRAAATGAAKEAPMEMLQGGQERHAANKALQGEGFDVPTWQGVAGQAALEGLASAPMGGGFGAMEGVAHKGVTQRQGDGAAAFAAGEARKPPESIKSVVGKAQWVRGWDAAQAQAHDASNLAGAAPAAQWTTSPGAADPSAQQAGTALASPANAPNLDYETLPGATPDAQGNEIDFAREYPAPDWGTDLGAAAPVMTPSQAMGLDPNAGALSKAAVLAVDSGASPVVQQPAVPAAEHAPVPQQAVPQAPEGVDPDTGEISLQVQMDELKGRIAFMQQQGAAQGWSKDMVAQRNALQTQLTKLEVQAAAGQKSGASTTGAPAPAELSGIHQILAKQVPEMNEQELQQAIAHYGPSHKRTKKLEKALQLLAQKPLEAIETGAKINGDQTLEAQQGSAQPAQAGKAQAVEPAAGGVSAAQTIAKEGSAQREQQRQRLLDASERWTRMPAAERQALTKGAKGLNAVAKANVHKKAWADLSEKMRGQLADAINAQNAPVPQENNTPAAIESEAVAAQSSALADAPAKPAAQPVGDEKPFAPETGTLGIPRADMPQVPTANHGGLVKHLNAQGIAHETKTVDAADLKPTQAEYSPAKVEAAKSATGDRAVIVSSDGHIIDGHHQAVAAAEEGKQVKAIVLDAPVEKALEAVKASPSANSSAPAAEPAPAPKSVPQRMKEAKAAKEVQTTPAHVGGQRAPVARPDKQDLTQAQELAQGQIENRERQKNEAWAKVKQLRAAVKEGTANRLQLLKAEDAHRQLVREVDGMRATEKGRTAEQMEGEPKPSSPTDVRFRRQESEHMAAADFDVASFLQIMNEGQPAGAVAAAASAKKLRPSYSPAARAEAVRAVTGTVDAIRKAWANGPDVIVAFDMQDSVVPESARRADLKQRSGGAQGAPEGFYYKGKVYLMASKLKTPGDAARVLFHEALGHHGLRGLFGKDLGAILNQVATMRKADVDAKIAEYGLRRVNKLDRRTAAEEVLAEMAQNTPEIGFVRRAVAAIRTWLRTHVPGFKSLALTDAELIRNFILPARAWVERGGADSGDKADATFCREAVPELRVVTNFMQARQAVKEFQGKPLTNDATGMTAVLARNSLDKMLSGKAVEKSETPATHAMAVANADSLFKQAILGWSKPDRSDDANIRAIHRFFAPMQIDGRTKLVKLTVKEGMRPDRGNPLYTVEAVELNENLPGAEWVEAAAREDGVSLEMKNPLQRGVGRRDSQQAGPRATLAQPHGVTPGRSAEDVHSLAQAVERSNTDEPMFSRSSFMDLKDSALDQLSKTFTHEGKVSLWDKTVGTMRNLAERAPAFKPVYESAQQNIEDVSMLANDAADMAPRILPRVETLSDLKKKPVSAADNKAVARPLFEGTLIWARDENGKAVLVDDLQKRYESLSVHNKAAMLLKQGKIDSGVLAMWQGLPVEQFEKLINSRFESKMLKPGIVWTDSELKSQFGATDNQISLYREARAAIDRSIDLTARTDMLRVVGEDYAGLREVVLAQPSVESAAQLLLDTLQDDAKANPDAADRLGVYMQQIKNRMETAADLQAKGYAPLSRFGRYTVDVVDANGERQYFGMYESQRESNLAKMQLASEFKGATITQGTMSAEAYKLFAGVTPETLEQFGEMLGLKAEGNEAQDKAFQEFLKLTKNNHSAMKRLIHRKGIAGFSEDVGRVVANFVYSNARAGAMGLNAGKMDKAIGAIPKEQGELKDLAMGLRSYIRDPQEEGQAVRGMLFAQYLGGSIASAFVNTTQPFAVTLPWLSQYGGMKKAAGQMTKALNDMRRSWMDKSFSYEPDLVKALQSAEDDGVVSPQEIHQLMAQARGAGMLRSGDGTKAGDLRAKLANKWEQGKVLWGQPFALAEQFNRRSTFIAAYRTAREQGIANPGEFARNAVIETQFQYSKANKPRWVRGAVGGTLFTFKTYSVSYLELMNRMWTQGGPEGKRAVGWALAMLLLMSGAGGVPFMEDAEDLIDGAGQLMGYNISAKQWRKEALASVVGKELAEFMEQGISGLPGAPVDVSGRLGMGNLLPGTGLFLTKPNRERDLTEIVGPAGDLVSRAFTGGRDALKGALQGDAAMAGRGVLEWAPTAVRNAFKGLDMAATGMYKDGKGYKVIDTTLAEAMAKLVGFQPKSVAEVQEANSFMLRSKSFYTQTSSEIKAQWADALFRKDEAAVQRVRERLTDWNRNNPEQPIVVKMPDVWKKVREMGKDRSARIADTAPKALREQMREQVRSQG